MLRSRPRSFTVIGYSWSNEIVYCFVCPAVSIKRYRYPSICLSQPRLGKLAACSRPASRDARTADPSADGRRSAASRTAIGGVVAYRLAAPAGR